jgi:hypothetical protein
LELRREVHIELELKETFFEKRREGRSLFLARREEKVGEHFERKFGNGQDTRVLTGKEHRRSTQPCCVWKLETRRKRRQLRGRQEESGTVSPWRVLHDYI